MTDFFDHRTLRALSLRSLAAVLLVIVFGLPARAQPLRILVTNDDGYNAPGIDALVTALSTNPNLDLHVIAPATNSSGTGDQKTLTTITVTDAVTLSGFPAKSIGGFPADTVLFGTLQQLMGTPPDLVVSGINLGQNMTGDLIPASGTVGAAYWAARIGIPAIAVSASLSAPDYANAAIFAAHVVEKFRTNKGFQKKMKEAGPPYHGVVLNINYPTCTTGTAVRGAKIVAVGRLTTIAGYTLQMDMGGVQTWQVNPASGNFVNSDCTSTLTEPATDLEAWNNGFVAISPLDSDRSLAGRKLKQFKFVERLF